MPLKSGYVRERKESLGRTLILCSQYKDLSARAVRVQVCNFVAIFSGSSDGAVPVRCKGAALDLFRNNRNL
jgi:hypothetical protein